VLWLLWVVMVMFYLERVERGVDFKCLCDGCESIVLYLIHTYIEDLKCGVVLEGLGNELGALRGERVLDEIKHLRRGKSFRMNSSVWRCPDDL